MFYEPDKNNHGLRFNPFKSICVPRPIAWVSSLSASGVPNLAPFSQFTNLSFDPPHIVISARANTDTARNVNQTGEFVINMATLALKDAVNATSAVVDPEIDEAVLAGLEMLPSTLVKPRRVAKPIDPALLSSQTGESRNCTLWRNLANGVQDAICYVHVTEGVNCKRRSTIELRILSDAVLESALRRAPGQRGHDASRRYLANIV